MFDLLPPDPNDAPAFDAVTAYERYEERKRGNGSGIGPTIVLARMIRNSIHGEGPPHPGPRTQATTRLVYLIRWEGVTWQTSGPAPAKGAQPRSHEAIGTHTVVLDAHTGEVLHDRFSGTDARSGS